MLYSSPSSDAPRTTLACSAFSFPSQLGCRIREGARQGRCSCTWLVEFPDMDKNSSHDHPLLCCQHQPDLKSLRFGFLCHVLPVNVSKNRTNVSEQVPRVAS